MPIMTNIREKRFPIKYEAEFIKEKELHDCFDCEGCICEEVCKEMYAEMDREREKHLKGGEKDI